MIEKTYQPSEIEGRIYRQWEDASSFTCGRMARAEIKSPQGTEEGGGSERASPEPFSIVIPPPNVTGSLHMGHALNNTLQDILCRFERLRGRDVLWQPGMDHAGIATQMVVERQLEALGEKGRREIGREAFLERVWAWKEQSGGTIINQLKRLGASCDWERERFTMDEGLSRAVIKVFIELYSQGLIYKDQRLVNWDPKFQTAISDLEVVSVETEGHLWHFRYPLKEDADRFIIVATTRPETMLGDSAVAVHPSDPRYRHLIGKTCLLPLVGRELPIVADDYADPEQGSGAVKITPAHDFNDFEVGRRHGLEMINIFDEKAHLNASVPPPYRGLERFQARQKIIEDLEALGLVEKIEDHLHTVPHGERGHEIIEPYLTEQWYVNAGELAKPAIQAVVEGRTRFVPKNWEKTYFEWMRNIQPWCISRQLWWGHQIPAWYGPDGEIFVAEDEAGALRLAKAHYGKEEIKLTRDPDVLDTWFSSALWPFSTLGWPDKTLELERYYPTNVLVTGFDIIFFWVARMMMMGLHFMDDVPFQTVYIHALVRDEKGQKMSKTKGNVIDPLALIDDYGADALRFTLAAMAAQGRDIKLATSRVEGYRNFATKIWNAARFCQMNDCVRDQNFDPQGVQLTLSHWISGEAANAIEITTQAIEAHRYNEAAAASYHFVWHIFCDWYLELIKPAQATGDDQARAEIRAVTAWVLDQILILLHPFMPFITEELWARLAERGESRQTLLIDAEWPNLKSLASKDKVKRARLEIDWIIRMVTEIRSVRAEINIPAGAKIPVCLIGANQETIERTKNHHATIERLARCECFTLADEMPEGAVQLVLDEAIVALPLKGVLDVDKECERLQREIEKLHLEIKKFEGKLSNEKFLAKAPSHVVDEQRVRKGDAEEKARHLGEALARIGDLVC